VLPPNIAAKMEAEMNARVGGALVTSRARWRADGREARRRERLREPGDVE